MPLPFAERATRANRTHMRRDTLAPRRDRTSLFDSFRRRSVLRPHLALPPPPALPSHRACVGNATSRYNIVSVLAPVPRHTVVGHCLLLVHKRRIRIAPPSLSTHFRPTRLSFQPELTRPIFSIRARICSPLSHPSKLIVLLVSTACYLTRLFFLNSSKIKL